MIRLQYKVWNHVYIRQLDLSAPTVYSNAHVVLDSNLAINQVYVG